jgi:hypothetical protein
VKVTTATPQVKPQLLGSHTTPKRVECKLAPAPGLIQVTYPNGIKVSPAIYAPKSADPASCDLNVKARAAQPITVSFAPSLFGNQVDWILNGQVELTTFRSAVGLGMVSLVAKEESFGNLTNTITFPASSFTKPVSDKFNSVRNPSIQEIVKNIHVEYEWISTGQVLTLTQVPSQVWKILGASGAYTQQSLANFLSTSLKLTDKPTFANGLTRFDMKFRARRPFEAMFTLHDLLAKLPSSYVVSAITGTIHGKPGAWSTSQVAPRSVGLRLMQDTAFIQVAARNMQALCAVKTPFRTNGQVKFVPRLSTSQDVSATLTKMVCKSNVVVSWQASWNVSSSQIDLTPPELSGLTQDLNDVQSGNILFDSITGLLGVEGIVRGLAVKIAPVKNAPQAAVNVRKSSGYYGIQWAFAMVLNLTRAEPVQGIKLRVHTGNRPQLGGSKSPWVSLASPKGKVCHQLHHIVPCLPPTTRNAPTPDVWPLHSTSQHIVKFQPKQTFEAFSKALLANLTVEWSPGSLYLVGVTQVSPDIYPAKMS